MKFNNKTIRIAVDNYYLNSCTGYLYYGNIENWDTSEVTDMSKLFINKWFFNQNISKWNTANVTNMGRMFYDARAFNQDIKSWDTSNVTNMRYMFYNAHEFNQDIKSWDTSNVTDMSYMFYNAYAFNKPKILKCNLRLVSNTKYEYNVKCPICTTINKITENTTLIKGSSETCCVCMENNANVVFAECGHLNTCLECVKKLN